MIKEIKYGGFTASPSDYDSPDGELAAAINIIPEDGELKPVRKSEVAGTLDNGDVLSYVHVVDDNIKNYIIRNGLSLYYRQGNTGTKKHIYTFESNTFRCSSNGNVLCVYGVGECVHFLYADGTYSVFASGDMNVGILFGLDGQIVQRNSSVTDVVVDTNAQTVSVYEAYTQVNVQLAGDRTSWSVVNVNIQPGKYRISVRNNSGEQEVGERFYINLRDSSSENRLSLGGLFAGELKDFELNVPMQVLSCDAGWAAGTGYKRIPEYYNITIIIDKWLSYVEGDGSGNSLSDKHDALTSVMGVANSLVADIHNANRFVFPFFVRYGFRLLTGEVIPISAPILMEPNTNGVPEICINNIGHIKQDVAGGYRDATVTAIAYSCKLQYKVRDIEKLKSLIAQKKVSALVIAVSSPIYLYKQSATDEEIRNSSITTSTSRNINRCYAISGVKEFTNAGYSMYVKLPDNGVSDNYEQRLANSLSVFRIVKEIDAQDISFGSSFIDVPLDNGKIAGLSGITDILGQDVSNLSTYDYKYVVSYNMREHASGISEILFGGYDLDCMSGYVNGNEKLTNMSVVRTKGDESITVYRGARNESSSNRRWIFYPYNISGNAKIYENASEYTFALTESTTITGMYHFGGLDSPVSVDESYANTPKTNFVKNFDNTLYVSTVGDPTVREQSLRIGDGIILAIAASTKPVSRGQMGQVPLFVFATDGIWALELMTDGKYMSRQALSRDVCLNTDSITQIDDGLLYVCGDMIKLLKNSDSDSICITDEIHSDDGFLTSVLPKLNLITHESITAVQDIVTFNQFLKESRILYDHAHRRVIVYNPAHSYAYVYSLKSKMWGMMESNIQYSINSYPECLVVNKENAIINMSEYKEPAAGVHWTEEEIYDAQEGEPAYGKTTEDWKIEPYSAITNATIITRPLKLDAPDILKSIFTVIQRGKFGKGHVKTVLYGSCDLFNWHVVASSVDHCLRGFRGTPYKYFRIVLLCNLESGESIFGCTVQYEPRLTDRLR